MPSGIPKTATPEQVARYGHVAAVIREFMHEKGWSARQLMEALDVNVEGGGGHVYRWIAGKSAPSPKLRAKVAKIIGCKPEDLAPHNESVTTVAEAARGVVPHNPARRTGVDGGGGPVLQFAAAADGEARIRLDVTMPIAQAMPLLRMLLDAGILMEPTNG